MQYLVQKETADSVRPRSPEETIAFIKQYVLPTLDVCDKLLEEKKIVAGGPVSGAIALSLIVSVESVQELDDLITSLPVWPRMETTVTPLSTFDVRIQTVRSRLEQLRGQVKTQGGAR